jgi:hypothetical protein
LGDSSQVSDDLFEKKDLDKRVRALTILTKEDEIPDLTASYFDAHRPLPVVCFTVFYLPYFFSYHQLPYNTRVVFFLGPSTPCFSPSSLGRGAIPNVPVSTASEAPEAEDSHDGDEGKDLLERTSSTTSPPPTLSKDIVIDKKRKRVEEFASSSASAHKTVAGETAALEDDVELFDLMDS